MCVTFVFVDLGRPDRAVNLLLYPSPRSVLFWDVIVLNGYLLLNIVTGWTVLESDKKGVPPPAWVKPLIILSIPWAVSIHTVTAFIYSGLPGRGFWLTAIMAPRFLASAFASGPALLILFCLILRRFGRFDAGEKAIQTLAKIVTYALATSIFFVLVELFTVFYSQIPGTHAPPDLSLRGAGRPQHHCPLDDPVGGHRPGIPCLADHPPDFGRTNPFWLWPVSACFCHSGSKKDWGW